MEHANIHSLPFSTLSAKRSSLHPENLLKEIIFCGILSYITTPSNAFVEPAFKRDSPVLLAFLSFFARIFFCYDMLIRCTNLQLS